MGTVAEHLADLRKFANSYGPNMHGLRQNDPDFQFAAILLCGVHLDELEALADANVLGRTRNALRMLLELGQHRLLFPAEVAHVQALLAEALDPHAEERASYDRSMNEFFLPDGRAREYDANPDGITPGQDSPVRMDPGTGAWNAPERGADPAPEVMARHVEVEARDRRDARRYRWLRNSGRLNSDGIDDQIAVLAAGGEDILTDDALDHQVDIAMNDVTSSAGDAGTDLTRAVNRRADSRGVTR